MTKVINLFMKQNAQRFTRVNQNKGTNKERKERSIYKTRNNAKTININALFVAFN